MCVTGGQVGPRRVDRPSGKQKRPQEEQAAGNNKKENKKRRPWPPLRRRRAAVGTTSPNKVEAERARARTQEARLRGGR